MIKINELILRRTRLVDLIEDNSIAIIYASKAKKRSADESFEYVVNRNFYYLTNISQEDSVLVLKKNNGYVTETLYVHQFSEVYEKWIGKRLTVEEAKKISGIENVLFLTQFKSDVELALDSREYKKVYLDLDQEIKIDDNLSTTMLRDKIKEKYQNIDVLDIYPSIISLRMVKSDQEIEELKEAIKKTDIGLKNVLKNLKPEKYEYQMKAVFEYTLKDFDNSDVSFPTIVSSGVNACCLHYQEAKDKIKDGDLVLFDLGSLHNNYCADISRTYPPNGKFTSIQREIYEIVLGCNKMIAQEAKPGISPSQLNNLAIEYLANECVKHKLIDKKEDISNVYYHSCSHFIGLDTHDPAYMEGVEKYRDIPLKSGNVISNEPGLYFKDLNIGVRIEDDLLITSDGCINLSQDIIKEVDDIERIMRSFK